MLLPHSLRSLCIMTLGSCLWIMAALLVRVCCGGAHENSSLCSYPPSIDDCLQNRRNVWVIQDAYAGVIQLNSSKNGSCNINDRCIIAANNKTENSTIVVNVTSGGYIVLLKKKYQTRFDLNLTFFSGQNCCSLPSCAVTGTQGPCSIISVNLNSTFKNSASPDPTVCRDIPNDMFMLSITKEGNISSSMKCDQNKPTATTIEEKPLNSSKGVISSTAAKAAMNKLGSLVSKMGNASIATVSMGDAKGILAVISSDKQSVTLALTLGNSSGKPAQGAGGGDFSLSLSIPDDALQFARQKMNVVYVGLFSFPSFTPDENNSQILTDIIAIEMGVHIYNLSKPIELHFNNVTTGNQTVQCTSWESEEDKPVWTTDGCNTRTENQTITCSCNHLTFFAILLSPEGKSNLSSTDLRSLTYISYIGCGISTFFLSISLFMHFLLRKRKASKSTRILMNLFLAMFLLNFTFLCNEWVANLKNNLSCIVIAMATHYFMLSTITWFGIEAFHLYLQLIKVFNIDIRHYMVIVLVTGWALPFVAPLVIAILGNYGSLSISTNDGYTTQMCWILNTTAEYIVNIGYYAIVFLFTSIIFIMTLQRIISLKRAHVGNPSQRSIGKELFTMIGLCVLLGITWGFAFFSYGSLRIPSYYIFTILNSFQGFFLFLYYYNTSRVNEEKPKFISTTSTSKSTFQNTMHHT